MPAEPVREYWIHRIIPLRYRERVTRTGFVLGGVCSMIWTLGAFTGLFLAPFWFSQWRPGSLVAQPVHWLRQRIADTDHFIYAYSFSMLAFIGIIYSGHTLFERLVSNRKRESDKQEPASAKP